MTAPVERDRPLLLEQAGPRHRHGISRLDRAVYPKPWSPSLWRREMAMAPSERCYVVASVGPAHVGHAGLMVQADDGHVVTVAVDPAVGGCGIGTQLMLVLAERARVLRLDALILEVRVANEAAQALYRRFGFVPAGARPGYYTADGEDALVMWAHDIGGSGYRDRLDRIAESSQTDVERSAALNDLLSEATTTPARRVHR